MELGKAKQYINDVLSGKELVCQYTRQAVERHVSDLKRKDIYFDEEEAERVLKFFPFLKHYKGAWAGKDFILEPYQCFIISCIFGWKNLDGTRRFRKATIEIPRKSGKTTIAAGIGLFMFVADGESGAEVYTGATTRDQAKICFTDARQMALVSKPINSRAEVLTKNMSIVPTASKFEYVSSDYDTLDGLNPHLAILDEVHAYKTGGLYDIFISAMGARTQPLLLIITTAGFRKEWWYYKSQRKGIIDILSGRVKDDTTFGIIYTLDEGDDWKDPNVWKKANPSLGVNIKESYLRQRVNDALIRPSETVNVMTKHFNVWTDAAKIWIPKPKWNSFHVKEPDLSGLQCFGGVDLSYIRDITAYTLCFMLPNGKKYFKYKFFVPLDSARDREEATGIPYSQWIREGHLIANDGNTIDYNNVKKHIIDDLNTYNIHTIGFDKANASHIMQEINDEVAPLHLNIDGKWQFINRVYGISPHVKTISPPTKEFERMVFCDDPEVLHDGNPVMEWMIGNVAIKSNAEGDIRPDKEKSEEKIDGVMSTILSIEQMLFWSKVDLKPKSKYEEEDMAMF